MRRDGLGASAPAQRARPPPHLMQVPLPLLPLFWAIWSSRLPARARLAGFGFSAATWSPGSRSSSCRSEIVPVVLSWKCSPACIRCGQPARHPCALAGLVPLAPAGDPVGLALLGCVAQRRCAAPPADRHAAVATAVMPARHGASGGDGAAATTGPRIRASQRRGGHRRHHGGGAAQRDGARAAAMRATLIALFLFSRPANAGLGHAGLVVVCVDAPERAAEWPPRRGCWMPPMPGTASRSVSAVSPASAGPVPAVACLNCSSSSRIDDRPRLRVLAA